MLRGTPSVRSAADALTIPIGRPLSNTQMYVLDRHFQPQPLGVSGELCIGGDGLAVGYLNRPELTAEKFVPNPYNGHDNPRLYRTGDLVRYLPDGSIEFQGRIDHQVKLRGYRIELGEIEAVLGRSPLVRQAFVTVRQDATGDDRVSSSERKVVAYVVPADPATPPTAADLRQELKDHLPEYMIPAAFVFMDALPINPNGKVDRAALQRAALPSPDYARVEAERPYVAPRSPVERFLTEKWQEVLGIEKVSVTDNFFELGGNSLQAAVLTNRMQEELGASAHVRALFMAPTIADLANYLDEYYPDAVARIAGIVPRGPDVAAGSARVWAPECRATPSRIKRESWRRWTRLRSAQFRRHRAAAACPQRAAAGDRRQERPGRLCPVAAPLGLDPAARHAGREPEPVRSARARPAFLQHAAGAPGCLLGQIRVLARRSDQGDHGTDPVRRGRGRDADVGLRDRRLDDQALLPAVAGVDRRNRTASGGPRYLVDKTPVYPMDSAILDRMEQDFAERQVHSPGAPPLRYGLLLHGSQARGHFLPVGASVEHARAGRARLSRVATATSCSFLERIPAERQHRVWFEEMVGDAPRVMQGICDFLQIDFHPDMLEPYKGDKMTSGIRPGHQMVGDFKFYLRNRIDPKAADRWKRFKKGDVLAEHDLVHRAASSSTRLRDGGRGPRSAERSSPARRVESEPRSLSGRRPRRDPVALSFAQERLWFLDQFEGGTVRPGAAPSTTSRPQSG